MKVRSRKWTSQSRDLYKDHSHRSEPLLRQPQAPPLPSPPLMPSSPDRGDRQTLVPGLARKALARGSVMLPEA